MFTGLIEDVGRLAGLERQGRSGRLRVKTSLPMQELTEGESISVNGACLTVESASGGIVAFHCLAETLSRTNLGMVPVGGALNLERAVQVGSRMGGHFVTGHVDFCSKVVSVKTGDDVEICVEIPHGQDAYFVEKGSVAVNGVSLTLARVEQGRFTVCLIPETLSHTNLEGLKPGDKVNIETDILGKYILKSTKACKPITMEMLKEAGF